MSTLDLIMDMETLGRLLIEMKVPKDLNGNYIKLLAYLNENCSTHPNYEAAKKLIKSIESRLD